jgi:hypothetical protein
MACGAARLEQQFVTAGPRGSKLAAMRLRAGNLSLVALVLAALAWSQAPQASYSSPENPGLYASETATPKTDTSKPKDQKRGMPKCPEGGERVPEKRSPYDSLAPLAPLVA